MRIFVSIDLLVKLFLEEQLKFARVQKVTCIPLNYLVDAEPISTMTFQRFIRPFYCLTGEQLIV